MGLCAGLFSACAQNSVLPSSAERAPEHYTVRVHDTLYSIAWHHGLDYRELARWNHIGADYRIEVGQVLLLGPHGAATPNSMRPTTASAALRPIAQPQSAAPPTTAAPLTSHGAGPPGSWGWPTATLAAPRPVPNGGILIGGQLGQDVRAANAGRVVYNGNGIRGYGNLIIIKHGETWLTAYAHNRDSLVREGQEVAGGDVIAHMGEGLPRVATLYFEIRENGKPVNPLMFLPPR